MRFILTPVPLVAYELRIAVEDGEGQYVGKFESEAAAFEYCGQEIEIKQTKTERTVNE